MIKPFPFDKKFEVSKTKSAFLESAAAETVTLPVVVLPEVKGFESKVYFVPVSV